MFPKTRSSILVLKKQATASSGELTIGSFSLNEVFSKILMILNKNCKEVDFVSMSSEKGEASIHFEIFPNSAKSISIIDKELNRQVRTLKVVFSRKENISL